MWVVQVDTGVSMLINFLQYPCNTLSAVSLECWPSSIVWRIIGTFEFSLSIMNKFKLIQWLAFCVKIRFIYRQYFVSSAVLNVKFKTLKGILYPYIYKLYVQENTL